jgi:hypothetical protein
MSITMKPFGTTPAGEQVTEYTLTNASGASVSICDFGGVVTRIIVPDRDGKLADVNLGHDSVDEYAGPNSGSMGMLIGRVGNRIANATFDLEGETYTLTPNNGPNNLHGGPVGFGVRMWQAEPAEIDGDPALILHLISEDGDQGFPGKVEVQVTYGLSSFFAAVVDNTEAFVQIVFFGDLGGYFKNMSHNAAVFGGDFCRRSNMLFGNDQHMKRSLRVNILESQNLFIFIDFVRRDFPCGDFAKQTIHFLSSLFGTGGTEATCSPCGVVKGISHLKIGTQKGNNGKLCHPFFGFYGLGLIGMVV